MRFTTFRSVTDVRPTLYEGWDAFVRLFDVRVVNDKNAVPLYCPAELIPGTTRAAANVVSVNFGVLDLDKATEAQVLDVLERFEHDGYRVLYHTTHSHGVGLSQGFFKCRIVVPFDRPVEPDEWDRVWAALNAYALNLADAKCRDLAHVYFFPSTPPEYKTSAESVIFEGRPIEVDLLIECAPATELRNSFVPQVDPDVLAAIEKTTKFKLCEKFLDHYTVAVEGQEGDSRTYRAAAIGKDFDLDDLEFWPLLLRWNQRCHPPWDEQSLWGKLQHANKYRRLPRGWRLIDQKRGDLITEDDLRLFMKQHVRKLGDDGICARVLRALLDGEAVDPRQLDDLIRWLAFKFKHGDPEKIALMLETGLKTTRAQGHRDVSVKYFSDRLKQEQQENFQQRASEEVANQSRYQCTVRDAFLIVNEHRNVPYSREEVAFYASERGFSNELEFERRWIVRKGTSFYYFVAGRYSKPYTKEEAMNVSRLALLPTGLPLDTSTPSGGVRPMNHQEILDRYSTTAIEIIADMRIQKSYFDESTQKLHEAVCPQQHLVPVFNPHVERWIDVLAGSFAEKLRDWLATFPDIREPTAALFLYGAPKAGKSLLAAALSRLWDVPGPTELTDVVSTFNDSLARCPVVFADETIPTDSRGDPRTDWLRKLIQERERPLRRKYLATSNLVGAARYIIAANNPDVLVSTSKSLTNKDISAIAERFLVIKVPDEAAEYLESLPSDVKFELTNRTAITQHMLWLSQNRRVQRGSRFLVEGVRGSELEMRLLTSVGIRSAVCKWIAGYLLHPEKLANTSEMPVTISNQQGIPQLLLTASILEQHWRQYNMEGAVPQTGIIEKALGGVCSDRFRDNGRQYRVVNLERISYWVNTNGFCSEQEFDAAVAKRGLVSNVIPMRR